MNLFHIDVRLEMKVNYGGDGMFDLTGDIALVSGGAHGIGKGIVKSLTDAGAKVMIADIDVEAGQK